MQKSPQKAVSFLFAIGGFDVDAASEFLSNPNAFVSKRKKTLKALESAERDTTRLELGKDWHALQFLLTGNPSDNPEHRAANPLHNYVMGGHNTKISTGYGPVRLLETKDVRESRLLMIVFCAHCVLLRRKTPSQTWPT